MLPNLTLDRPELDDDVEDLAHRPFQIVDGMILIAALFVAMDWDRGRILDPIRRLVAAPAALATWGTAYAFGNLLERSTPYLTLASVAVVVMWMRSPRSQRRRFLRSPGLVACALGCLALIPTVLTDVTANLCSGRPRAVAWARIVQDLDPANLIALSSVVGMGVAVAWIVLAATRRWRNGPAWLDRSGRYVGLGWMSLTLGGVLHAILGLGRLL